MTASRGEGWALTWPRKGLKALHSLGAQTWESGQCNAGPSAEAKGTLELGTQKTSELKHFLLHREDKWAAPAGRVLVSSPLLLKPGQQ